MAACEEVPLDSEKALKESRILVVAGIKFDCEVLKNLVSIGFRDIEILSEGEVIKSEAEATEKSAKSQPDVRVKFHTNHVLDYSVNFFKRFTVVFSIADSRDVKNYIKETCSAADVSLVEKEAVELSEKVIKEKFKTGSKNIMEIIAVYEVLQNFGKKQKPEVVLSRTKQDEDDPVVELTIALKKNMEIIRSNSTALDIYTAKLADLPQQIERTLYNQRSVMTVLPVLHDISRILREISSKQDRTHQILRGTVSYLSPNIY